MLVFSGTGLQYFSGTGLEYFGTVVRQLKNVLDAQSGRI